MALTFTTQLELGFEAPDFTLPDIFGKMTSFESIKGEKGTLVMFICNHCPFVKHVMHELVNIGLEYLPQGIGIVAINSNDVENYPEDAPDKMKEFALENNFPFPYLFDESQEIAKAYDAVCTPDFSLFDNANKCVYRGRLDGSRPGNNIAVNGADLRKVLNQLLKGEAISEEQQPSAGCNIKWKKPKTGS